jgi:cytidylate kinase
VVIGLGRETPVASEGDMIDRLRDGGDSGVGDPIDLITVSREFGAGGSDLARAVGRELEWPVLDRELVHRVAERLRLEPHHVEAVDEQPPGLLTRLIASALLMAPPELPAEAQPDQLHPDSVAAAARASILSAAESPPLIVVGHASQCLFRHRPGTLHIRLVAPLALRLQRVCTRVPCESVRAIAETRRMDQARAAYVRRHHQTDWRDPLLYDMQFNTGRITIDEAARLVVLAVHARDRVPASELTA